MKVVRAGRWRLEGNDRRARARPEMACFAVCNLQMNSNDYRSVCVHRK